MPLHSILHEEQHKHALVLRWPCKPAISQWKTKWAGSPVCHTEPDSKKWADSLLLKLEMNSSVYVLFALSYSSHKGSQCRGLAHSEQSFGFASVLTLPFTHWAQQISFSSKGSRIRPENKSSNFPSKSPAESNNKPAFNEAPQNEHVKQRYPFSIMRAWTISPTSFKEQEDLESQLYFCLLPSLLLICKNPREAQRRGVGRCLHWTAAAWQSPADQDPTIISAGICALKSNSKESLQAGSQPGFTLQC